MKKLEYLKRLSLFLNLVLIKVTKKGLNPQRFYLQALQIKRLNKVSTHQNHKYYLSRKHRNIAFNNLFPQR